MNERIKELRKALNLTQDAFAKQLGLKRNTVGNYETGNRVPSDQSIFSICREFNVNEEWLRNGTGEMFNSIDEDAEKSYIIGQIFITLGSMSQNFTARDWTAIKDFIDMLAGKYK